MLTNSPMSHVMNHAKNYTVFDSTLALFAFIADELKQYSLMPNEQHICLSGGSTPKGLFAYILANDYVHTINWNQLHFWWGDERCVSEDDEQSNYGEAKRLFFNYIDIKKSHIHPITITKNDLEKNSFESSLERFMREMNECLPQDSLLPVFDWILLGVGDDGHTASLFPDTLNLELQSPALLVLKPETSECRVSLSAKTIRTAKRISYLVAGESKANVMQQIITKRTEAESYPAALISSECGQTNYLLDEQAGSFLQATDQRRGDCQ